MIDRNLDVISAEELTKRHQQVQDEITKYLDHVSKELKLILPEYTDTLSKTSDRKKVLYFAMETQLSTEITALTLAMNKIPEAEKAKRKELDIILKNLAKINLMQYDLLDTSKSKKTQLNNCLKKIDQYKREKTEHRNKGLDKAENVLRGFTAFLAACTVILAPVVVYKASKGTIFKRTEFEKTLERSKNIIKRKP